MEITPYIEWFESFVSEYLASGIDNYNYLLKKDHTFRVLEEARGILRSLEPPEPLGSYIQLAALFHDVGRFPQYAAHGTFHDGHSVNHATLGVKVLLERRVVRDLPRPGRQVVYSAVQFHNRLNAPANLPPPLDLALKVVRDADKLDILRVLLEHLDPAGPKNGTVTLDLSDKPGNFSPAVLDKLKSRCSIGYWELTYINDFIFMLLSWVNGFNFVPGLEKIRDRNVIGRLISFLPPTAAIRELEISLEADLEFLISRGGLDRGGVR
ncbi:MAG: HD domain-containing protein [Pseudomonadota bacterium]